MQKQLALINETDTKAANVVKYSTVLVGAVFTALSVVARSPTVSLGSVGLLTRVLFLTGVCALLVSSCVAVITYLSSVQEYGPKPAFGYLVTGDLVESPEYEELLLNGYATVVRKNREVIDVNARRFRWSLAALLVGIVYTALAGGLLATSVSVIVDVFVVNIVTVVLIFIVYLIKEEEFLVLERKTTR